MTNDSGTTGESSWEIIVDVPCDGGCTLTPGYWKTHSEYGPAPYDDTWALMPAGADTPFFGTGVSYYEMLWTEPQGGFHMWMELPEGYSSIALFLAAVERGVAIIPGPYGDVDHRFVNGIRFGYGSLTRKKIVQGIRLLSDAVDSVLKAPPGEPGLSGLGGLF